MLLDVEKQNRYYAPYADYWINCPVCQRRVSIQAHPSGDQCPSCRALITEREVYDLAFAGQLVWTSGRSLAADLSHIHK